VLGLFYLTVMRAGMKGEGLIFANIDEAITAHQYGVVHLQAKVKVRINGVQVNTSVGRIIFSQTLPEPEKYFDSKISYSNEIMTKRTLSRIVDTIYKQHGPADTADMLDRM